MVGGPPRGKDGVLGTVGWGPPRAKDRVLVTMGPGPLGRTRGEGCLGRTGSYLLWGRVLPPEGRTGS